MPVKNEQLNFAVLIILLFFALAAIFFLVRPISVSAFLPYILIAVPIIFLIALFNTDIALVLLIFSMLLSPELALGGVRGRAIVVRLDDIFLFLIFFGWMTKMAINKELGFLKTSALVKPIWVYILICIISSCIGVLRGTTKPLTSFFYIFKYFEYFLIFFMVANNVRTKAQIKFFVVCMFITAAIVGLYGLFAAFSLNMRATAPFEGKIGEANTLAGYLIFMMGIAGGLFLYIKKNRVRFLLGGFLLFSIWPFLYTYSRSGLMGFFTMYLAITFLAKRHRISLLLCFIIFAIIAPNISQKPIFWRARQAFTHGSKYELLGEQVTLDESASARIRSWQSAMQTWVKNPIIGEGVASGRIMSDIQYGRVLREVGSIGFIAFVWLLIRLLKLGWNAIKNENLDNFSRGLALGHFCALLGLIVMGLGAEVFIIVRIMGPFWFLTAIISMLPEINNRSLKSNFLDKPVES
ncbi:MAG: O-antigen ligase family protein [Candidatus Omnitrophica bacterium]|nr:O-antigen ligase family protein [Candidatus Omnitrophota bacterium]